jgi:hypothetical protein
MGVSAYGRIGEKGRSGGAKRPTGGEPLWNVPKDFVISTPLRGRPNYGVKQAAPGNYHTRSFVHRSVRRFFIRATSQQT